MTEATTEAPPETPPASTKILTDIGEPDPLARIEDQARDGWAETLRLSRQSCEHLLDCGRALADAATVTPPDAWIEWLKGLGIPRLAASRLLELHRVALDTQALEDLGGVVLAVTLGDWQPGRALPVAYVWQAPGRPGHYCAGRIDLAGPPELSRVMR